ncbi:hypothetical protein Amsp01_089930 [Amycolatopsis sp. NBRC 101858]|uniref:hypothetical protein n=1 Tax=Amycolatopsis sp. NBRC 101858 TaxID=3032200 RepID=UPI00249F9702|nr:hypothetical protein [Amycolatopsis sp. NBRC 101858]GLY42970.1 hypothetical protein Amsp01_089930 [Amycolatopsis sp. NBRC 101858]
MTVEKAMPELRQRQTELTALLRERASIYPDVPGRCYSSIEALLLEQGRWFTPADLPDGAERGPERRCYANASLHSEVHGLIYVEGFALAASRLHTAHAWCTRPDGTVEDPTWGGDGLAYLGIPFTPTYLLEHEADAGAYAVLFDQHRTGWQLLTRGLPEHALAPVGLPLRLASLARQRPIKASCRCSSSSATKSSVRHGRSACRTRRTR